MPAQRGRVLGGRVSRQLGDGASLSGPASSEPDGDAARG